MENIQDKLTKVLLLCCSLVVLFVLVYAAYKENFAADWYRYQSEYKHRLITKASTERQRDAAERFDVGQKQLYLPALDRIDRCVTCHVSVDNPSMKDAPQPLMAHSGEIVLHHPKEQFGCTICHEGQGRATIADDAHGHVEHWPKPMLAKNDMEESCPKCHTDRWLPGVDRYNAAMDLFYEQGCLSCHKVRGRGGDIGPDITKAGEIHDAKWHFKHFKDPKSVVETSEMPNKDLSDEQAQQLTFLMMCYKGEAIPTELLSNPTQEASQMKLPEPLDPEALEGYVGSQFCISCHAATHPGTVQTWRDSKMAAAYEPIRNEPVKDNCIPCHTTGLNYVTGHYVEEGVGCEACHGPGREAVRLVLAGKPDEHKKIIQIDQNSESVCARCHNPHVPIASHAEFYRKLPLRKLESITTQAVIETEQAEEKKVEPSALVVVPAPIPVPLEPVNVPVELPVKDESSVEQVKESTLPATPEPLVTKTVAEQEAQPATETEPNTESLLVKEQELSATERPEPNQPATTITATEPEPSPPVTETKSVIMGEQEPSVMAVREPNLPIVMPDIVLPESITMPVFNDLYSVSRPPEKIEGGCVSATCHTATILGEFVHGPTGQQNCEACHKITDEPNHKFEPIIDEPNLCYECHDRPPEHEFQHGPVSLGVCTVCHNPHSGPEKFMLPETGNNLCFRCHTDKREYVHSVHIEHDVINEEGCIACHDPHSSDINRQLKKDMPALCLECHEQISEIVEKAIVSHEPVKKDNKCANCHEPHGGEVPGLLVSQEANLCLDCHDKPMETSDGMIINMKAWIENNPELHGPIREGSCTLCHQPHGSQHFRILTHEFPRKFYSPFSIEVYDLCFQCHEDTLVLDERTTALTDFRNGDKNLHYVHVNKEERGRTCRACHEVHAGTKPKRMKDFVPYGSWMYPVNFELTPDGGKCAPGCHLPRGYNRKQAIIQR
jgi:predicted CXXCH cytochrome family protein